MEPVIKSPARSPNTLDEILDEKKPRVNTITDPESELENNSAIDTVANVEHNICQQINNPVYKSQDKNDEVGIFRDDKTHSLVNESIDCIPTNDNSSAVSGEVVNPNKQETVEDSKDSDSMSSAIGTGKTMNKPSRSRVSCRKLATRSNEDKKRAGKNTPRKVLVEKQARSVTACNRPGIFLRSNRRRNTNLLSNNQPSPNTQISDENQITKVSSNGKIDKDCETDKENIVGESGQNSNPRSLGNEKQDGDKTGARKTFPYESLSLMEKIIIREHAMLENICNSQARSTDQTNENGAVGDGQKSLANGSNESGVESEILPKKKYHRRKCSEPFKNERVQTRQSRNITSTQNKNEFKCFTQVPKTMECIPFEPDEKSNEKIPAEECTIICTPDINMNNQAEETFSDENKNPDTGSSDKENNDKLRYKKDAHHASSFTKTSPGDKVSSCKKNDPKSTSSINSRISPEETSCSIAEKKDLQLSKKRGDKNADGNPKRKLRHLDAQVMPVYLSSIAVTKNENKNKSSDANHDKAEEKKESPVAIEKRTQHCFNNVSSCGKSDKATDPRYSYLSNTDSEETLSNVESVPNSPAQDIWPKVAGRNVKFGSKCVKFNSGQSSSQRKDSSLVENRIPKGINLDIAGKNHTTELKSTRKRKYSQIGISSTWNCGTKKDESELRYYLETSRNKNPSCISDRSERNVENNAGNEDLGGTHETPWLRHYERPHKTNANIAKNASEFEDNRKDNSLRQNDNLHHQQQRSGETSNNKKTGNTSVADNSVPDNLHTTQEYMFRRRSGKLPQPVSNPPLKKRGRPRKQAGESSQMNSEGNKRNPSTANGSGLSEQELERLFFKFLQDGHFRIEPGKSTAIFVPNNDFYGNSLPRMQCYDPKRYFMPPQNMGAKNHYGSKTCPHFPTDNDGSRFYRPNNSPSSGELGHRLRTLNPNSCNFSTELAGQTAYSKNLNPYSMRSNINSDNTSGHNAISHPNSLSNYMQSGYGGASNYHQTYNNNPNVMGNNSYANSFCGMINSNSSMNDVNNTGTAATNLLSTTNYFDDDFNSIINTHNQHQNSLPGREVDLTTSNQNRLSSNSINSMQNSPASNVNTDWNLSSVNQQLDSVNGILMDLNLMNNASQSNQAVDGNPDSNNFINNSNSAMNSSNPWISRSNNVMNPRFPVLLPWQTSLPMYNSYLNNSNSYYNNMFNPYAAIMGFDFSNYPYANMNSRNAMGINNENQWMQNIHPSSDGHSNFNTTNTEFSNMNSGPLQENTSNQGMNLSLTSNTILPQTNSLDLDANSLGNELNSNIELFKENTFAQVGTDENNDLEQSSRGSYGKQKSLPYTLAYKNDVQNIDFNEVNMVNIDENTIHNHQQQNLPQIQDYINQRSDTLEDIVNRTCRRTSSLSCEVVGELTNNRETEMSKLRQELADFTRQYSEDQTSPTSQIPQGDEIFI